MATNIKPTIVTIAGIAALAPKENLLKLQQCMD